MSDQSPHGYENFFSDTILKTANVKDISSEERKLRRLIPTLIGMKNVYFDDGEAFGQELGVSIDFMTEPADVIQCKIKDLLLLREHPSNTPISNN